jgi:AraC-like DNA-binding protein
MENPILYTSERKSDTYLAINSCGENILDETDAGTLRENGRIDFGIQYIAEGKGYYEENGETLTAESGTVLLYFPNIRQHYFFKKEDKARLLWAHCTGKFCEILDPIKQAGVVPVKIIDTKDFERVFKRMTAAYHRKEPYFQSVCDGYMQVLLSLIIKNATASRNAGDSKVNDGLENVLAYMNMHFHEPIDLTRYAKMCYVSRDRFLHMFKAHTGVSPYKYQLQIRIDRATEMLIYSSVSINEISLAVGFRDCSYFCRIFKKFTGKTPTQYRK